MSDNFDEPRVYFFIATLPMQTVIIEVEADSEEEAEKKARLSSLASGAKFQGSASEYLSLSNA